MSVRTKSIHSKTSSNRRIKRLVLPVAITVLGLGAVTVAAFLVARELKAIAEEEEYDVENYDIVGNSPMIYSFP